MDGKEWDKMAKLTKTQLKGIVKECLVELLAEGLAEGRTSSMMSQMNESSRQRKPSQQRPVPQRPPSHPDLQDYDKNENFETKVNETVGQLTNDPIMSQIFADTARTTLQSQVGADRGPGAVSMQESVAPGQDIQDLEVFAEGAKNWAHLAFPGDNTKK